MFDVDDASTPVLLVLAAGSGLIEAFFPPFPSESLLLLVSFAGARRGLSPVLVAAVAAIGSFLSLYALYAIGAGPLRHTAGRRIRKWSGSADERVRRFFDRFGTGAVLVSRFLPAVRGPLTFLAGVYGLSPAPVALALLAGCLVWNAVVVWIGFEAGSAWDGTAGGLVWVGLGMAGAVAVLWGLGLGLRRLMDQNSASSRR